MTKSGFNPCDKWAEKLATPKGDLLYSDYLTLREHVKSCQACSSAHGYYEEIKNLLRTLPAPEPAPGLPPRLEQIWQDTKHLREIRIPVASPQPSIAAVKREKKGERRGAHMSNEGESS